MLPGVVDGAMPRMTRRMEQCSDLGQQEQQVQRP